MAESGESDIIDFFTKVIKEFAVLGPLLKA